MINKKDVKSENMMKLYDYRKRLLNNPKLVYLFLELTDKCTLQCLHCGTECRNNSGKYIDTEALIKTLKEISEDFIPGNIMVCFTGGEPLLYPDFFKIVNIVNDLGFPWGMTTNGTLIDDEIAFKLKKYHLGSISVSIDGNENSHDWFRNKKGAYKQTIEAIGSLNKAGIDVQVTTVVHKKNILELESIYEKLLSLRVKSWRLINIEPIGRAASEHKELLLSREELLKMMEYIRGKRFSKDVEMDIRYGCSHYLSFEYEHEVRDNYFICGAGIFVASILCNGDIFGCLDIERKKELIQGNIANDRFYDIWINRFKEYRRDRSETSGKCSVCEERFFCGGDSFHTWDFDNNEPKVCILGKE